MAGARTRRARAVKRAVAATATPHMAGVPDAVERAVGAVATAVDELAADVASSIVEVTLATGVNRIAHKLGRKPSGMQVTPRTASAAFAAAFDWDQSTNPTPERLAFVDVVGGPMRARIVFF